VPFECFFNSFFTEQKLIRRYGAICWPLLLLLAVFAIPSQAQSSGRCVDVPFDDCKGFHNKTTPFNSSDQITTDVISLRALYTGVNCSEFSQYFICAAAYPICVDGTARFPCKQMCQDVRLGCSVFSILLNRVGIFNCELYPIGGRCITEEEARIIMMGTRALTPTPGGSNFSDRCPLGNSAYFSDDAKDFAKGWLATWTTVCFVSTMLTILTFLVDRSRFDYPWRPIVYLAACYNIHCFGYYLSLFIGNETVTCPNDRIVRTRSSWSWEHTPCILVFMILYYTMMAFTLWWLVLTFNWFLATALKWSNEAIARFAPFYHGLAWSFPLLMTIIILATRLVGADELLGTCFIVRDNGDSSFVALLLTVIIPLCLILFSGCVLIVIGFIDVLKIRSFVKQRGKETGDLEKLMIRIGVFVVIYIVPALIVISAYIYELDTRPNWNRVGQKDCSDCSEPNVAIFMARVFFLLIVGILSGVWIWSKKTVETWKSFFRRVRDRTKHEKNYGIESRHYSATEVARPNSVNSTGTDRGVPL